jgi:acyl-CoA synthetase (AMP-forming)/AMP-acid ligase II
MAQLLYADLWEAIAAAIPDQPAAIRGATTLSWGEFNAHADALAQHLLDAGLSQQAKVAAYLYNSPEYLEVYFAAFKAALVPFNTNYRYGGDELVYLFDNADAEAIVFHASFAPTLAAIRHRLPKLKTLVAVAEDGVPMPDWAHDYASVVSRQVPRVVAPWGRSANDQLFIYTGGTTGSPKGVMWRQVDIFEAVGGGNNLLLGLPPLRDAAEAGERARERAAPHQALPPLRAIPVAPLMHATGQIMGLTTLATGGCLVTLPSQRFHARELFDEIVRHRVAAIIIVGTAFAVPMLETLDALPGHWDLSCLQRIFSSGSFWSAENKRSMLRHMPHVVFIDSLGSSEALGTGFSLTTTASPAAPTARFMASQHTTVFTESGQRVTAGSGERGILATTGFTPLGYYKDPERSAQTFRIYEGARWSVTGDWATIELDGSITLLGRGSLVINTGGEKVFPEEVEEVLKRHPSVRDAAVVGVPDPRFGERICAVVEASPGETPTLAALAEHVRTALAAYKAPRELVIANITRQPNGKLDYQAARTAALAALK